MKIASTRTLAFVLALSAIMAFGQAPVIPSQPNAVAYGFGSLQLLPTYTRDTYRASFGPAPVCDPSQPLKGWFDSTRSTFPASDPVTYNVPNTQGTAIVTVTLTNARAASVNLAGRETYPAYVPVPTTAHIDIAGAAGGALNPLFMSTPDQAEAMRKEFGASSVIQEQLGGPFSYIYPDDEPRRYFDIVLNGAYLNVGGLLQQKYVNGVGSPGTWHIDGANSTWTPTPVPDCSGVTASTALPIRPLLDNEKIQVGLMGAQIVRTDLQAQQTQSAGGFTDADRANLIQVLQLLKKVMGVQ